MTITPSPASNRRFFVDGMEFEVRAVGPSNVGTGITIDSLIMPHIYNMDQSWSDKQTQKIGKELCDLLFLHEKSGDVVATAHGTKSPKGLARAVRQVIRQNINTGAR